MFISRCTDAFRHFSVPTLLAMYTLTVMVTLMSPTRAHATDLSTVGVAYPNIGPGSNPAQWRDLNHDHRIDFVTQVGYQNSDGLEIQVVLQQPNGKFEPGQLLNSGDYQLTGMLLEDVNGDGKLDVVACGITSAQAANIVVFLGNGDGTFQATPIITSISSKLQIQTQAAGDFNGDGKADLAFYNVVFNEESQADYYYPTVLLGKGDGKFGAPIINPNYGFGEFPLQSADMDHDGHLDLVTIDIDTAVNIFYGIGNGHFGAPVKTPITPPLDSGLTSFTIGDVNGDHLPDVVLSLINTLAVVPGAPGRAFGAAVVYDVHSEKALIGDVNRDGYADVITLSGSSAAVLEGSASSALTLPSPDAWFLSGEYSSYAAPEDFAALVDVDGDGILDILGTSFYSSVSNLNFIRGIGNGKFRTPFESESRVTPQSAQLVNVDLNHDGKRDLVVASNGYSCSIQVLMGNGDGTFTTGTNYPIHSGSNDAITGMFAADVNHDGNVDIIVVKYGVKSIYVLFGNGDGTFQPPIASPTNVEYAVLSGAMGDFTGDGQPDLLLSTLNGTVVYKGSSNGQFTLLSSVIGTGTSSGIAVGDFNGDGKLDFATGGYHGTAQPSTMDIYFGDGAGGFTLNTSYTTSLPPIGVVCADFNEDGKPDLAFSMGHTVGYELATLLNDGTGHFTQSKPLIVPSGALAVGDFNSDGINDLVTTDDYYTLASIRSPAIQPGLVSLLIGKGDGTFEKPSSYTCGPGPEGVVVGHFNFGAKVDVATANFIDGTVTVLLNQPTIDVNAYASASKVTGSSVVLTTRGKYTSPAGEPALKYNWSSTGPAAVTYTVNDNNIAKITKAKFTQSGVYVFTCTITDPTGGVANTHTTVDVTLP